MKKVLTSIITIAIIVSQSIFTAYAATPTLSLSAVGGDAVRISVSGDPNASVKFYYSATNASGVQIMLLDNTNSSGSLTTTINASSYAISPGGSVYVVVNGQQSPTQVWPSATSSGAPSLSQSSVTLGLGQSITISSQGSASPVYMVANSNPSIAAVQTNGTQQITITANQIGSTTATICYIGTASNCANLNVTVQSNSASTVSLSQSNITLVPGRNISISINGGGGTYSVTNNSNPASVSTSLSGNVITIYGTLAGSANITICDQSNNCATLSVAVNSNAPINSLSFDRQNVSITTGQTVNINVSGGTGYFVSNNSHPGIASQAVNGNVIVISGLASGSTTITVCSTANGCGPISVTVNLSVVNQTTVTATMSNAELLATIQNMQNQLMQIVAGIQAMASRLTQLASVITTSSPTNSGTTVQSGKYKFFSPLGLGAEGMDVTELQKRLTIEGLYSGAITGYYGDLTQIAVKKYQAQHGLPQLGIVGPATRELLNR